MVDLLNGDRERHLSPAKKKANSFAGEREKERKRESNPRKTTTNPFGVIETVETTVGSHERVTAFQEKLGI